MEMSKDEIAAFRQLRDKEEIKDLLVRYASALDSRNWESLREFFTTDAQADYGGVAITNGIDELVAMISGSLEKCGQTQHLLGNMQINVHGDKATSVCYLRAMHAGKGDKKGLFWDLCADYRDELVRTDKGWRITKRVERTMHAVGDIAVLGLDADMMSKLAALE